MKKITLFAAFALVALLSSQAIAASPTGLYDVIFGSKTSTVMVEGTNVRNQTVNVQILNEDEHLIVNENFTNREDFIKKYDLAQMKDGDYQLIITKKNCRVTQPFMIDGGYVQMSDLEKKTTYFPVFTMRKDKLDISILSEKYGDITINVLNKDDETVHTETVSDVFTLQKRYNFNDLKSGDYKVEVTVNGESFFYEFRK